MGGRQQSERRAFEKTLPNKNVSSLDRSGFIYTIRARERGGGIVPSEKHVFAEDWPNRRRVVANEGCGDEGKRLNPLVW